MGTGAFDGVRIEETTPGAIKGEVVAIEATLENVKRS
jgi:hypothetical protein